MPCRVTQDEQVKVKSSDKTRSTGRENGKPLQYSCCKNPMNNMKRQKDIIPETEPPRSEGVQYATGEVVQLLSHVRLFATPWTVARQASLSFTIFQSLLKLRSIESVMPSNHLILCRPLLLLPSIFPSIRVFSNESQ